LKELFLEADDDELSIWEMLAYHGSNMLSIVQIKSGINLVKDIERCWLELQECQDQAQGQERALTSAELRQ